MFKYIYVFLFLYFSIINIYGAGKERISLSDLVNKISDTKEQISFKFNILHHLQSDDFKLDSNEKDIIHYFLNDVLINKKVSKKNKLLAVEYYSYFKIVPDKSKKLLKDNLLFYNNSAKVIKQFYISTAYLGNWFNYEYYNQLIKLLKMNSKKLDIKKRFLVLWLLHSEPKNAKQKVDLGKMSLEDYFIHKGDLIYYNILKDDAEMLLSVNIYPDYSEWKNFCYSMVIDEYISKNKWKELVQRHFHLVIDSNNINAIKPYLKFQESNPDYELPYLTNKQSEQLNNIKIKYPDLKELTIKVLSVRLKAIKCMVDDK